MRWGAHGCIGIPYFDRGDDRRVLLGLVADRIGQR